MSSSFPDMYRTTYKDSFQAQSVPRPSDYIPKLNTASRGTNPYIPPPSDGPIETENQHYQRKFLNAKPPPQFQQKSAHPTGYSFESPIFSAPYEKDDFLTTNDVVYKPPSSIEAAKVKPHSNLQMKGKEIIKTSSQSGSNRKIKKDSPYSREPNIFSNPLNLNQATREPNIQSNQGAHQSRSYIDPTMYQTTNETSFSTWKRKDIVIPDYTAMVPTGFQRGIDETFAGESKKDAAAIYRTKLSAAEMDSLRKRNPIEYLSVKAADPMISVSQLCYQNPLRKTY